MARILFIDGKDIPRDIYLLGSALGMDNRKTSIRGGRELYKPYRNYFCTRINDPEWLELEKRGLVDLLETKPDRNWQYWKVTPQGRKYVGRYFRVEVLKEETGEKHNANGYSALSV